MLSPAPPRGTDPWYVTFHDLMPFRVREILLVSSPYDAFALEEDGRLTEHIFSSRTALDLSSATRITHVSTSAGAMTLLGERRFDLVLTMPRLEDSDVSGFARRVKAQHPDMPVVLLIANDSDLAAVPGGVDPEVIDHVFAWTGDGRIVLAIVKLVEDCRNVAHDTRRAGVRCIIVVEDSVRRYSSFLSILYAELMAQSDSLSAEGVSDLTRIMRMRARPKLLLARSYEAAFDLYQRYREFVVAVITDVRFPRGGEEDPLAGLALVQAIRALDPDLPLLMQSAGTENAALAKALGVHYLDKGAPDLLRRIRRFVAETLGFGDFVFRLPNHREVGRARDMWELELLLPEVPAESLEFHATHNHFSLWMMARCMFELASRVRPTHFSDFGDAEGFRRYLLHALRETRLEQQQGVITDVSSPLAGPETPFVRVGTGSIGGKARGLAFVASLLARSGMRERFPGLAVRVPRSVVLPTDEFDRFVARCGLQGESPAALDEHAVLARCLEGELSPTFMDELQSAVARMLGPLAVRSSSLLEDGQLQPFAGIYATYMLPNNAPRLGVRFEQLCQAVKAVYASTFSDDARAYIQGTPYALGEEKMAVLVQEVVGRKHGQRFYPQASGTALSYNYYPIGGQQAEGGLAMVALGLGQTVAQGGAALQFSPATPSVLPQFGSARDYLRFSQRRFWALDLSRSTVAFEEGAESSLVALDISEAEADGTLHLCGSVYDANDDAIREDLRLRGPRVVTFHNILKWGALPLADALRELLALFREGMGCPVELEFALDVEDASRAPTLYVLQVRPQGTLALDTQIELDGPPAEALLCRTDRALGHGVVDTLRDIVLVKRQALEAHETVSVAEQVGRMNARLQAEHVPYLLVGPGRWGSSDPRLGIPVRWSQIAGAKVMVETPFGAREVEPSQGAHFFHNVTSCHIGYLTLSNLQRQDTTAARFLDLDWLLAQAALFETEDVRHIRLARPLRVMLDGRKGAAVILKPGA